MHSNNYRSLMCVILVLLAYMGSVIAFRYLATFTTYESYIGETNVEIVFVVFDDTSGHRISGATIEVQPERTSRSRENEYFVLITDSEGEVRRVQKCFCSGTRSILSTLDSCAVALPAWTFRGVAEGYESSEWKEFWSQQSQVQKAGSGKHKIRVVIPMRKVSG